MKTQMTTVLLQCDHCNTMGLALIDRNREHVHKLARLFVAEGAGDLGLQFRCARCSRLATETEMPPD
jgi:hypothetical protein